ncbi:S24/S26 family peptidase [Photobacterium leiognathi]|uniref:hypothetical protein n=1 Tax=Photobacterium leiognathi TaxID=553611 RepID=UPI0029821993|nr:hypothetical protein [Photobacterium leiognathi]
MPFPPPTAGYEDKPIGDSIIDYLQPRPTVLPYKAPNDLSVAGINEGDILMCEAARPPANGSIAIIAKDSERIVVKLHWHKGKWFAETDFTKGAITDAIEYVALVRHVIKDQLA